MYYSSPNMETSEILKYLGGSSGKPPVNRYSLWHDAKCIFSFHESKTYPRELTYHDISYIPPWKRENHLHKCLGMGYVIVSRRVSGKHQVTRLWSRWRQSILRWYLTVRVATGQRSTPKIYIYFHQSIEKKTNKSHGKKSVVGRPHYPFEMAPFVRWHVCFLVV